MSKLGPGLPAMHSPPDHLNSTGCCIKHTQGKGRGIFASQKIPPHTTIEISPVLLFDKLEYQTHAKHTILDKYTFSWRDGRYALALGLGSLFNHSRTPNVTYTLDRETESIRYTTSRAVEPDEELCIFYGHNLWFEPMDSVDSADVDAHEDIDDGWRELGRIDGDYQDDDPHEVIPEDNLPFEVLRLNDENPEEDIHSLRTMGVWVVDIPDPRHTSAVLKWTKQCNLEHPCLDHLKRVRRQEITTVLLSSTALHQSPPPLPPDIHLGPAYTINVPARPALTVESLHIKSTLWPTIFTPPRKHEPKIWTRAEVRWAEELFHFIVAEATKAQDGGQLPIASCIPVFYEPGRTPKVLFAAHDTRNSSVHPLRHPILDLIRQVGDSHTISPVNSRDARNGSSYLLTSHTVFTTHEPCIMCSMALLHSRVAQVVYLIPMEKTGGCGGVACLPKLETVNHRFRICRWKDGRGLLGQQVWERLQVGESVDA